MTPVSNFITPVSIRLPQIISAGSNSAAPQQPVSQILRPVAVRPSFTISTFPAFLPQTTKITQLTELAPRITPPPRPNGVRLT
jgi:hypothetical protein